MGFFSGGQLSEKVGEVLRREPSLEEKEVVGSQKKKKEKSKEKKRKEGFSLGNPWGLYVVFFLAFFYYYFGLPLL